MSQKVSSFFRCTTVVTSLCFLTLTGSFVSLEAKIEHKFDESVTYTMNFRNINIVEYIRFVSRIAKTNFIFNESELNFPVTLVSDQPVSAKNLFSALAQVLEVNGFSLSDQEGSILITKNTGSSQLAPLNQLSAPLITRIYKIENVNLSTLTQIVKAIVSKGALVESLLDTHQLIVTDTGPNLEKLGQLIHDLDTSGSNLKILTYKVKHQSPFQLSETLKTVMIPFQGGNPYLTLPQANNNQLLIISTPYLLGQTQDALLALDIPDAQMPIESGAGNIYLYIPKYRKTAEIRQALETMAETLKTEGATAASLVSMINTMKTPNGSTCLLFVGSKTVWGKMQELLDAIDNKDATHSLYIYQIQSTDAQTLESLLQETASKVEQSGDPDLLAEAIDTMTYVGSTNSLVFSGAPSAIAKLKEILPTMDEEGASFDKESAFFIYELKNVSGDLVIAELKQLEPTLNKTNSKKVIAAISNIKWLKNNNSLLITGSQKTITTLEGLIAKLDVTSSSGSSYAFYAVKGTQGADIVSKLHSFASNLPSSTSQDKQIQESLKSTKYMPETQSILIHGSQEAIAFVESLAQKIDEGIQLAPSSTFVVYTLKGASGEAVLSQLHEMALHINDDSVQNKEIKACLETVRYLPDTNSIMISGSKEAISFTESLIEKIDLSPAGGQASFYLYKLESQPGSHVIAKLQTFADKLPQATIADKNVIQAIKQLQWIHDNNTILISGNQQTIDRVSALIAQYDFKGSSNGDNKGDFLIYSPQYLSLDVLEESIQEYAVALKQSGLADVNLIETINTAKVVPSANHLVFTGNSASIAKVKTILELIDQANPQNSIQHFGQTTFLVHQLKSLTPDQFSTTMKSFENNISKNSSHDPAVAKAIAGMQYLKETNSFLFTGPEKALDKVAEIANKIDSGTGPATGEITYDIYNPHYLDGLDLIEQMCQFAQGLLDSGVKDQGLYDTINGIKWIEKSNAMIITGTSASLNKVQDLLKKFDVPGNNKEGLLKASSGFMVYKLQYHSGTEIQQALNKLAPTFVSDGPNPNPGLAAAINSIQWIHATNSLVASGDADNLEKLKTLITEIDTPLKQVFIEVLVIETDSTNTQNFGLQWFGKGQLKNQVGFGTGNFGAGNPLTQSVNVPNFNAPASNISLTNTPTGQSIPFFGNQSGASTGVATSAGFDLGVIGDILFHKGKSFLSLGSLVNALQADSDSTIVMNPKIISQDNQNSTIFIGQNIPFIGSNVTNTSANTTQSANIEYRDVGTNLSITPKLGDDAVITLEITYSMSAQIPNSNGGTNGFNGIQTSQTNMTTRVHVPDQHFVVLSGMLQDTKQHYKTGIPCLGGLPIIGVAFSDNERFNSKSNILIFIRPSIVHNLDEFKELTEKQESKYRDMLERRVDKEDFDRGLNIVKEPHDE